MLALELKLSITTTTTTITRDKVLIGPDKGSNLPNNHHHRCHHQLESCNWSWQEFGAPALFLVFLQTFPFLWSWDEWNRNHDQNNDLDKKATPSKFEYQNIHGDCWCELVVATMLLMWNPFPGRQKKKSLPGQTGKGLWVVVVLWNLLAAGIWQILISCRQTPPPHSTVLNQDSWCCWMLMVDDDGHNNNSMEILYFFIFQSSPFSPKTVLNQHPASPQPCQGCNDCIQLIWSAWPATPPCLHSHPLSPPSSLLPILSFDFPFSS